MSVYYYRRHEVDNSKWAWVAALGIVLIAIGLIINAFGAADLRDLTNKLADIEVRRTTLLQMLPNAENEFDQNAALFARHWSEGFEQKLSTSRDNLENNGTIYNIWASGVQALQNNNRTLARQYWEEADAALNNSELIIIQILGPPGTTDQRYYDILNQKTQEIDSGYIDRVQASIDEGRQYINTLPAKALCGSSTLLSYESALSILNQASIGLNVARTTLTVIVPDGVVDKPVAYDQAQQVANQVESARTTAEQLNVSADQAQSQIANCQSTINLAASQLIGAYDSIVAQSKYNLAISEGDLAYQSCISQDFSSVTTHVNSCVSYANMSISAAEPPPPTSVPSNSDNDDSPSSSSGWDWNSDSDSSGSSDDEGSDTDWSSDSDWGGDDNWGSDDSWDSSDDWGSDDSWDSSDDWGSDDSWDSSDDWGSDDGW